MPVLPPLITLKKGYDPVKIPYYLICNVGTFISSVPDAYPRHLILSQLYVHSLEYRLKVADLKKQGKVIIMDNGAHEGHAVDHDEYLICVTQARPDIVVLPDIGGAPSEVTKQRSLDFMARVLSISGYTPDLMYCPQGNSRADIKKHFKWAYEHLDASRIIIGMGLQYLKWETGVANKEQPRLQMMYDCIGASSYKFRHHILGARWTPWAYGLMNTIQFRFSGLDTVKPCACALANTLYPTQPSLKPDLYSQDCADPIKLRRNVDLLSSQYGLTL